MERGNQRMQAYLSFIQYKSMDALCSLNIVSRSWFNTRIKFKYFKLV